jgi:integrase/recombinase XerD
MLMIAAHTYLAVRRASGFALRNQGFHLKRFAAFSEARGHHHHIRAAIAIEWARLGRSGLQRARRLGTVIRFARYLHAEDERHEVPPAIFWTESARRPTPYILTTTDIRRLITAAAESMSRGICGATYSTLFALLACTGLESPKPFGCA